MMGIFAGLFERRGLEEVLGPMVGGSSASGVSVNEQSSLRSTAVFACVRVLAESVGSLPLILYQRGAESSKTRATALPLYSILHDLPNAEMTSAELRETLVGHMALWGNAYCEIERNKAGRIMGLWPLRPDKMTVDRRAGEVIYVYELAPGQFVALPAVRIMHLRSIGMDGLVGYSPIALARQAVGLSLATEEFGARFFSNGARPGAVLEHPGKLNDKTADRLRESWTAMHQGLNNSHRVAVLEEGLKLHEIGIPPEDAQFLETRRFQVNEIARIFRVPPHLIGDLDRATFSNVEQQSLDFVIHTLRPWLVRWEQAIYRDLLTAAERQRYFVEFLVDGLLRGDIASRYSAYAVGRQNGWLSANDIRAFENMNPVDHGDVYLVPLNMIPSSQVGQPLAPQQASRAGYESRARGASSERLALANVFLPLFEDTAGRVVRREIADVQRAVAKYLVKNNDVAGFTQWLRQFYGDHEAFWLKQVTPLLTAYGEQMDRAIANELGGEPGRDLGPFVAQYGEAMAAREAGSSLGQLEALLAEGPDDPAAVVTTRLEEWNDTRPAKVAHAESRRANNALAKVLYIASGVTLLRWMANGDTCPYCRNLDGKIVGVQDWFLKKDEDYQPDGAERPMNVGSHNVGHPPLHGGCDCMVVAG